MRCQAADISGIHQWRACLVRATEEHRSQQTATIYSWILIRYACWKSEPQSVVYMQCLIVHVFVSLCELFQAAVYCSRYKVMLSPWTHEYLKLFGISFWMDKWCYAVLVKCMHISSFTKEREIWGQIYTFWTSNSAV